MRIRTKKYVTSIFVEKYRWRIINIIIDHVNLYSNT